MYVDKRLDGVQAVQTLSRLNRTFTGKDAPFVLDFVNDAENIFRAFKPYYDKTELAEPSDPAMLEALKHEIDQMQVYHWSELEMLYSFGRFLLPHLPLDRDATVVQVGDEVTLQYYRLERVFSGAIEVREGEPGYVKSPTEVGTGKAGDERMSI